MFANLLKAVHHQIGGNGKPNAGVIFLRIGKHRFIDADDFPADVDEGPPEFPGKILASVWIKLMPESTSLRSRALIMPRETVVPSP